MLRTIGLVIRTHWIDRTLCFFIYSRVRATQSIIGPQHAEEFMKVFLTGANGFIGSVIVSELIHAGHSVLGVTRSDAGANALISAGAQAYRGSLEDLNRLRSGAEQSDGVIHCAYNNDLSNPEENDRNESQAIEALSSGLEGSNCPLIITSVVGMGAAAPGQLATEDFFDPNTFNPRKTTEIAGSTALERGVNVSIVRLAQVHNTVKQGFVSMLTQVAREKGISAYIGDGTNRWPAVHVLDAARLYRLALQRHVPGARYHAVDEEGIPMRQIAEAIGAGLKIPVVSLSPEEAKSHFGWFAMFVDMDMPASSSRTQQLVRWLPSGPGLIHDLERSFSPKRGRPMKA
jgi:nucleoside-diphosphate-sugar epimerase